jgi:hypothetical protein
MTDKVAAKAATRTAATATKNKRTRGSAERQPIQDVHAADLEKAVQSMKVEYVQCRDFGHSWRPYHAKWWPKENAYESQLRCARCSCVRTRWLSRTGSQIGGAYDYPAGYQMKGLGRLSGTDRDVIRLQSILSVLVEDTAEVS